jgi:four helix bundle protein
MAKTNFEKLRIYNLSEFLADTVWDIVMKWEPFARDTVGKQIVRAADSIGANIAEGVGRGTYKDNRCFARNARGSLNETKHWLRRAFRRKLLNKNVVNELKPVIDELAPKLNAYLRYLSASVKKSEQKSRSRDGSNGQKLPTTNH